MRSAEVRAAEAYLERAVEAEDASPLVDTPNARAAHAERLEAAERALQEGRSANLPTASQRAVVRASDIGDAPPAAVAARQAALKRAQLAETGRASWRERERKHVWT